MARADLYKLANYSMKLFKMIQEGQELEGWVQAKITKAADYIASVYHFMEYEMKASEYGDKLENSDVYSESVRLAFQQKLMEAKRQAEKVKKQTDKVEEGFDDLEKYMKEKDKPKPNGGGKKMGEAGLDPNLKTPNIDKQTGYMRKGYELDSGAMAAADADARGQKKYKSRTEPGIINKVKDTFGLDKPDPAYGPKDPTPMKEGRKSMREGFEEMQKYLEKKRGPQPSGGSGIKKGSRYGGSKQAADKEDEEDEKPKKDKKVKEAAKPDYLDFDKDGNKKEPMKKALKDKKVKEGAGCNQTMEGKSCPVHGLKECPMEEAVKKGLYYNVNKRKAAGTSRDKNHPKAPSAKDWKDAAKTAKK
jgi:hypothetical protein